jgi:PAS domain S-box-containing protein
MDQTSVKGSLTSAQWAARLDHIATSLGVLVALVGTGHLVAWFSGHMFSRGFSTITMKTNAALVLLLEGLCLVLLASPRAEFARRWAGRGLAALAALIGLLSLTENLLGWDLGIDHLLAQEAPGAIGVGAPNLMGTPAATCFLLAGLALLILSRKDEGWAKAMQGLALAVCLIALLGTIGYLYGAQDLYAIARFTGIAWPTALALLMLGLGLLLARPTDGLMAQVTADDPGGANLRHWLPVLLLPIALGWFRLVGERRGLFDAATGTATMMIIFIVALAILAYAGARAVSRSSSLAVQHIEARMLAEQRAVEQEQASRYARSLLEASLDPLVTISADGKITDVNEATIKVTGVAGEELIGTDFSNYFTEPQKAREGYQQVFAMGYVTGYPLTIRHRDGHLTDVLYNATVYRDTHGNVVGVFAAARDITEKKVVEAELEKYRQHLEELIRQGTDDLMRSNKDLEQFAYVASHDLQEPLRAVAGFVELLRRSLGSALDSKAASYMDFAVDGTKRMQSLINGLLEYSRVGQREEHEETSARAALDMAMAFLRKTIEESGAEVVADELPAVRFDSTQLTQLFQNLIGNAIKFRGKETPRVHIGAKRESNGWQFAVSDNGIGVEPEYAAQIFLIFQRLHSRENYPGTGIGLAICKKIVENHRGRIWVKSKPGEGSTFYFTIPDSSSRKLAMKGGSDQQPVEE